MVQRDKGFGFLTPDDGAADVFVHVSEVVGGQPLQEGEPVSYDVRQGDRGLQATHVVPLAGATPDDGLVVGTVSWFAEDKGFGFVTPDGGGADVFVHVSQVEPGVALREGDRVEMGVRQGDRGPQGEDVRLLGDGPDAYGGEVVRLTGTVSWFTSDKGFGFLVPDDLFVHGSAVEGMRLEEGQRVEFEVRPGERGPQAERVRVLSDAPARPARERPAADRPRRAPATGGRATGSVSWFAEDKGFGFVTLDDGSGDVFVHASALGDGGSLAEGERVDVEVVQGPRGPQAADGRRLG